MDAVRFNASNADARCEGDVLGPVDLDACRFLQAGDIAQAEDEDRIVPAHGLRIGDHEADVGFAEAPADRDFGGVNIHIIKAAMQNLGRAVGCDLELLRCEHSAALHDGLDALVAVLRLDLDRVGHDEKRSVQVLRLAPDAGDLIAHTTCAVLAFRDERSGHCERQEQQQDQKADQAKFKCGALEHTPRRRNDFQHVGLKLLQPIDHSAGLRDD